MIEVRDLRKVFPARKGQSSMNGANVVAVDKLSFSCSQGKVFGLLGPNGAGSPTARARRPPCAFSRPP
jgi:ABC-type multidrug transport system ATPase subunit